MRLEVIIPESVYLELKEVAFDYEYKQKDLGLRFVTNWENAMKGFKRRALVISKETQATTLHKNSQVSLCAGFLNYR